METVDVIVIGAGPAGIAVSIQLKRYGIEPLVFERNEIGGLLRNANNVESIFGFSGDFIEYIGIFTFQLNISRVF